ncbi:hypothetical protein V1511DRAFT_462087 [Dipodascopsis uninucleata]
MENVGSGGNVYGSYHDDGAHSRFDEGNIDDRNPENEHTHPLYRPTSISSNNSNTSVGIPRGRHRRRDSVATQSSIYGEMAQDRVFDGPISDSVPTSISAFAHRQNSRSRSRSVSTTRSFRFFDPEQVEREHEIDLAVHGYYDDRDAADHIYTNNENSIYDDEVHSLRTVRSSTSIHRNLQQVTVADSNADIVVEHAKGFDRKDSTDRPLLENRISYDGMMSSELPPIPEYLQQTVYLSEEDLILALAGYSTSKLRLTIFIIMCICTCGITYLISRWIPKVRIFFMGYRNALSKCDWIVLENQWGELSIHDVTKLQFNFPMSSVFSSNKRQRIGANGSIIALEYDPIIPLLQYFDYRYMRLIMNPLEGKFELNSDWRDPSWTDARAVCNGLDTSTIEERMTVFGENSIEIEDKSIPKLLIEEVLHPFYIFQLFSMVLWSLDEYYYYASCILAISVISIINTLVETKSNMRRLREISKFECNVRVLRDGFWVNVPSTALVPGDIYEISDPSLSYFPCDSLQLTGDSIVNESMLTGESIPVSKYSATSETLELLADSNFASIPSELAKCFLFCGTKIVRVRKPHYTGNPNIHSHDRLNMPNGSSASDEGVALAMVVRTGFNTTKGALVRSMLFPKPTGFKFYRDSFKYIAFMSLMAAAGFVFYTITFIRLGLPTSLIIFRALDLITIVVPPALPATLTIGTNIALSRLKKRNIFCISPNRVNVGGKLDVICFDKTGTLTEDGLDVLGVHVVSKKSNQFSDLLKSSSSILTEATDSTSFDDEFYTRILVLSALASCHSLRLVDDDLLGDPLDYKMFSFTEWEFEENGHVFMPTNQVGDETIHEERMNNNGESNKFAPSIMRPPKRLAKLICNAENARGLELEAADLGVIRSFEFISQLRRMSVIVRRLRDPDVIVYVKGAPEIMTTICVPESFPSDYEETLQYYTHKGYRVIGLASKTLKGMSWYKAQKLKREEVESELSFLGFIVFENKLKPSTTSIIRELEDARIRTIMCTGDNVLTAISVGRECGLVSEDAPVFVPHFDEDTGIRWQCVDNDRLILDSSTLLPLPITTHQILGGETEYSAQTLEKYTLAVTGQVFRYIMNSESTSIVNRMLVKASIYARMSPDEKHELVEKLQEIDYSVGFCGDGANDCGALKAADVGISLSEAEASVAAPFTSRVFEISCVPDVIREGRASLVTSFSCFKYMSLYSAIQFSTVGILYNSGTNLGDFQFLMIDMFLILPIAVFMAWAGPYPILCPKRPTANLVSQKILINLLGQIFVNVMFQLIVWQLVKREPWYTPPVTGADDSHVQSSDNTSLFLASCFQYIFIAIVLSVGPPYRQPFTRNIPFVLTVTITTAMVVYILMSPPKWLFNLLVLTEMSSTFKILILGLACINFVSSWIGEKVIFPLVSTSITGIRRVIRGGRTKARKSFKLLMEEFRQDYNISMTA